MKSGKKKSDTETMQVKVMDVGQGTSSQQDQTWTLKQMAVKAEIIAMLHFAAHNVSFGSTKNLPLCYQQQFPDSVIAKQVSIGPTKMSYMVSYGLGPLLQANDNKRYHRRAFILHTTLWCNSISPDKEAYGSVGALLVREGQCFKS